MADKIYNVLFLCTGNSARSVLAECIMNREGAGRFKAYSAGSTPKGEVLPEIKNFLEHMNHQTGDLWSKSWDEFAQDGDRDLQGSLGRAQFPERRDDVDADPLLAGQGRGHELVTRDPAEGDPSAELGTRAA